MKIPETFLPDKNLDDKVEQLSLGKKISLEDQEQIHKKLSVYTEEYLKARETGWSGILYISDRFGENRYRFIKKTLEGIMHNEYKQANWDITDYYHDETSKNETSKDDDIFNELYEAVLWKRLDKDSIHIIYTSDYMSFRIAEDKRKKEMLLSGAVILNIW